MMKKSILFLGNGINRAFESNDLSSNEDKSKSKNISREGIIKEVITDSTVSIDYETIKNMPPPMQIVIASGDNVDKVMKILSNAMIHERISKEKSEFCKKILLLPTEDVITANYTYELELTAGVNPHIRSYKSIRKTAKPNLTKREEKFGLYTYNQLDCCSKRIWHIHGEAARPSSMIMGHYYYGKLLREAENYVTEFMKVPKPYRQQVHRSWVDAFLTSDVYILGFGLDLSELDIWWLICCKKRNFPNTKIVFYTEKTDLHAGFKAMIESYGIHVCKDIPFENNNYKKYYENAVLDINARMTGKDE